jgi:hypothetical protein
LRDVADAEVVWPDAPQLQGITMQLLERELAGTGVATRRSRVRVQDVVEMDGAFLTNARGIASVRRVDDRDLPESRGLDTLVDVYAAVPWDAI